MIGLTYLLSCSLISSSFLEESSSSTKNPEMSKMLAVDFEVFGIVQGVFFRKVGKPACVRDPDDLLRPKQGTLRQRVQFSVARDIYLFVDIIILLSYFYQLSYTQKRGKELGLKGWCMNTSNGTVVGHLEGEKSRVEEMKQWLRHTGSPQSRIDKAEFRNEKEISQLSFSNFEVRRE